MNTHAEKSQENKSLSVANEVSRNQSSSGATFQNVGGNYAVQQRLPVQKKENKTGLPDPLKTGVEHLSGYSMDDVKVHYNSNKPTQLNAHAYAQGTDIHVASGQERHLPHEAWHVVQQKQGRVKPTMQMNSGVKINDDEGLEKEADVMGTKALQKKIRTNNLFQLKILSSTPITPFHQNKTVIQRGSDPIDESGGTPFKFGLIKGTYRPEDNTADMHVENKTDQTSFSPIDVYRAFDFVFTRMTRQKRETGKEGQLIWNPQGAAVIKMVAELIGESLGNPELLEIARISKAHRKEIETGDEERDQNIISQDIMPEHLQYIRAARGAEGVDMQASLPGGRNTEESVFYNMLEDSPEGRSRFEDYQYSLLDELPVSLRITIAQTQLGILMETMKSKK